MQIAERIKHIIPRDKPQVPTYCIQPRDIHITSRNKLCANLLMQPRGIYNIKNTLYTDAVQGLH